MRRWAGRQTHLRWLVPGMGVKRWVLLLVAGLIIIGLGLAGLFEKLEGAGWSQSLTDPGLQFWNQWPAIVLLLLAGCGLVAMAVLGFTRTLLSAFRRAGQEDVAEVVYRHRHRQRGPKVVAIGGGHGLNTLLRGLKEYTDNITAIVTVADDGGSSGRLRRDLGMLPPGDFRNCLAALSEAEGLMTQLFQYRFGDEGGLGGHSFGNLYITAMAAITGSFEAALNESSRVLAVRGRVIPSTLAQVSLCGEVWVPALEPTGGEDSAGQQASRVGLASGEAPDAELAPVKLAGNGAGRDGPPGRWRTVCGESQIPVTGGRIRRVYLEPEDPPAYPEAIHAILEADLIIAGPGSLYTSVLPNLLVQDLAQAIRAANAPKVYVGNVATQPGETDGYDITDHLVALRQHVGADLFRTVLANARFQLDRPPGGGAEFVKLPPKGTALDYHLVARDLVDIAYPWRHDPAKLAQAVMEFVNT
jgi:2-phospho-L-lactate transferase/gluconeogenesis factor (CofD/UPF0052 family)